MDQVKNAEARTGPSHPVVDLIDEHLPKITELNEEYSKLTDNQEQIRHAREKLGFLADALAEAEPFDLGPEDIIQIWSRASEIFSKYQRYALARMLSGAYAIRGLDNPDWKEYPKSCLENPTKLPKPMTNDQVGISKALSNLGTIKESLDDIRLYEVGTLASPFEIAKRAHEGDQEAQKQLEMHTAQQEARSTFVLKQIYENFSNELPPVRMGLQRAQNQKSTEPEKPITQQ